MELGAPGRGPCVWQLFMTGRRGTWGEEKQLRVELAQLDLHRARSSPAFSLSWEDLGTCLLLQPAASIQSSAPFLLPFPEDAEDDSF